MFATWAAVAALLLLAGSQAHAVVIGIGNATIAAGSTGGVDVSVMPEGTQVVAGTQNDITFEAMARVAAKANGKPDCAVNPAINKGGTSFAFQPPGCTGDACTGVRALVLALDNVCPICGTSTTDCPGLPACPAVMYTCQVAVANGATGDFPLTNSNEGASDPAGGALPTTGTNGTVSTSPRRAARRSRSAMPAARRATSSPSRLVSTPRTPSPERRMTSPSLRTRRLRQGRTAGRCAR